MDETLVAFGAAVKALGDGKVGGYAVAFSEELDIHGERFAKSTNFWVDEWPAALPVLYRHGFSKALGTKRLTKAAVKEPDEFGVWAEAHLNLEDRYQRFLYQRAEAGRVGWSTGSAPHLVERQAAGKGHIISQWPLLELSLTPDPAQPASTQVQALKAALLPGFPELDELLAEGPEFSVKAILAPGLAFEEKAQRVASILEGFTQHARDKQEARVKEGRALSSRNRERLSEVHRLLGELLTETEPKPAAEDAEMASLHSQFLRLQARSRVLTGAQQQ